MEERKDIAKLASKLAKIGAEIGKMENDGKNTSGGGGYGFISYKAMEAKLRVLAEKYNVAFIPQFNDYHETELENNTGKKYMRSVVKGKMIIVCGDTGATLEGAFIGSEQDYGGKSMGQAETEATKRFYFKLFHVSDKEADPDENTFNPDEGKKKPTPKPTKSLLDEQIAEAMKKAGKSRDDLVELIKTNFAKKYGELTQTEKESVIRLLEGVK